MLNSDLKVVLEVAKFSPRLLPHLLVIYKIGHSQGIIDQIKKQLGDK